MLKINRFNCNRELVESVIDTDNIVGITERKVAPTNLYDEDGNVVETKENESVYAIFLKNGTELVTTKDTYDKLITKLNVETL
jgi:hypothetical protein